MSRTKVKPTIDWRWSEQGVSKDGVDELIEEIGSIDSLYQAKVPPVCYPGTNLPFATNLDKLPVDADVERIVLGLLAKNPNLIGTHTHGVHYKGIFRKQDGEGGFETAQRIEAKALWMLSGMIGGTPETVDGLFCGGGTEANLQGMWIGRQWLRRQQNPQGLGTVVLASSLVHYSVNKAAHLLDLGGGQWSQCSRCRESHLFLPDHSGSGVNLVGTNDRYEMSVADLERVFRLKYADGFRRFMIVATVGTTSMGSVDPIGQISDFVERMHHETSARIYVHVDASFGGFTVPFVSSERIGFEHPAVMSVTIDGDKMGRLPYPAGVFLCRKGLSSLVARKVNYVRGGEDDSVSGSRSALPAVLAYYQFRTGGIRAQREYVRACLDARQRLADLFARELPKIVEAMPYHTDVNMLPFRVLTESGKIPEKLLMRKKSRGGKLAPLEHLHLRSDMVPSVPCDVTSCPVTVYKVCVMPHHLRPGTLEGFVAALKQHLR